MKETCKPGGCSSIGCEGGFYCFNPDGTPKLPPTKEQIAQLHKSLGILTIDTPREPDPLPGAIPGDVYRAMAGMRGEDNAHGLLQSEIKPEYMEGPLEWKKKGFPALLLLGIVLFVLVIFGAPLVFYYIEH